jgi:hypothetical protein
MFIFKLDESYRNDYVFVVGGVLADAEGWRRMDDTVRCSIDFENAQLPPEMRVERYHAAEMNSLDGKYASWNDAYGRARERRMTDKLLNTLGENAKAAIAVGLDLKAHAEVFPEKPPSDPYVLCMQSVMAMIGEWMEVNGVNGPIALVHDQGYDDAAAQQGFEILVNAPSWKYHDQFSSIEPKSSLDDVGLQVADRVAYEAFKEISHRIWNCPKLTRPALAELRKRLFHSYSYHLDREGLERVRDIENAIHRQDEEGTLFRRDT